MTDTTASVEVNVPVRTAYDQWTQFESFPHFLSFVEEVTQLDDTHTHWRVKIAGAEREFDAEITEQHPDERVAWNSTTGDVNHAGVVTFHRLSDSTSRVTVQLSWDPQNLTEKVGAVLGVDDAAIKKDLDNFKDFIEDEGSANGAWRGNVS
ncbi:SRPBCC family protein [Parafrigoribacterium soli]|uniref:SRPBCC family protein n=1 Tax=Parafrigoribacterium soli TaxID=3144663 RepID=UPI0032EF361C